MSEAFPQSNEPLTDERRRITTVWHGIIETLFKSTGGGGAAAAETVTPDASPYSYTLSRRGSLVVNGGAVTKIEILRGSDAIDTGQTSGCFPAMPDDQVRVTYSSEPTLTFLPFESD